jgi:hypothetical protein
VSNKLMRAFSEVGVLRRLIKPQRGDLSPGAAREFLRWKLAPRDRTRMQELAAKARNGSLTSTEMQESESYERIGHLVALLKSKARKSLQKDPDR